MGFLSMSQGDITDNCEGLDMPFSLAPGGCLPICRCLLDGVMLKEWMSCFCHEGYKPFFEKKPGPVALRLSCGEAWGPDIVYWSIWDSSVSVSVVCGFGTSRVLVYLEAARLAWWERQGGQQRPSLMGRASGQ